MSEKRLYHSVSQKIIKLIQDYDFPPGSRLPGERDLAERFDVSRVTIREAEIALEAIGILDIRTGSGVYVLSTKCARVVNNVPDVSAFELTEARSLIESEGAALAATNITDEELDQLDAVVAQMATENSPDSALEHDSDRDFHMIIAKATKNNAIFDTIERLWTIRTEVPAVKEAYDSICGTAPEMRLVEHRDIARALRNRDPAKARQAMRNHFMCIIEALLKSIEERELEQVRRKLDESRERFLVNNTHMSA
jgi:DNA-binding FadR family transcriptional regulator